VVHILKIDAWSPDLLVARRAGDARLWDCNCADGRTVQIVLGALVAGI
jgi:hypothetical protein